jgi:hypothetical protein
MSHIENQEQLADWSIVLKTHKTPTTFLSR